jgi:uncharacterized membrane protein YbhN (UPF0104 family)
VRRSAWRAARVLVSLALVIFVVKTTDLPGFARALGDLDATSVGAALLLTLVTPLLGIVRFRRVLGLAGAKAPFWPLLVDLLIATAYNFVLPTTLGGDVVRAARTGRRLGSTGLAIAAVGYERVVGLLVLSLCGWLGAVWLTRIDPVVLLAVSASTLLLAGFSAGWVGPLLAVLSRSARLPAAIRIVLVDVARLFRGPFSGARPLLDTALGSLAYQLPNLGILAVVAMTFPDLDWGRAVFLGVPLALVLSSVPISIGGLGLRESLFVTILGFYGVDRERALLLSLIWLGSTLLLGALGVLAMLFEELVDDPERVAHDRKRTVPGG